MKNDSVFCGNEICCATYAFINTVQDGKINHKLFELSSSVPFGIKHQRENDFSRLLTTYCDPNIGLDRAVTLWGYRQDKKFFIDQKDIIEYIEKKSKETRCLVGPIDMGRLGYLILSNLYTNMDHYITIYQENGQIFVMDSEGILSRKVTKEEMELWFQVNNLSEAKGYLVVRSFKEIEKKVELLWEKEAVIGSMKWIQNNMREAQGRKAIEQCFQWLIENPLNRWKLSFLYDMSYLIQRKILQLYWIGYAVRFSVLKEKEGDAIKKTVNEQICLLGWIFRVLQKENRLHEQHFCKLAELEDKFTLDILCV